MLVKLEKSSKFVKKLDVKVDKLKVKKVKKNLPKLTGLPPKSAKLEGKKAARLDGKNASKNIPIASAAATTAGARTHPADIGSISGTKGTKSSKINSEIIIVVSEIII